MLRKLKFALASLWVPLLLVLAPVPVLAQDAQQQINNGLCSGANLQFTENPGQCNTAGTDATTRINRIVHTIVNLLSAVVGIVAVIMIIVGGFRYITSGGNDTSVTAAKNTILFAIIGIVVAFLAYAIVNFVTNALK